MVQFDSLGDSLLDTRVAVEQTLYTSWNSLEDGWLTCFTLDGSSLSLFLLPFFTRSLAFNRRCVIIIRVVISLQSNPKRNNSPGFEADRLDRKTQEFCLNKSFKG